MDTALAQNLHGSRPGALWQRNSDCWAPHAACVALANARPLRENKSKYVRLWWQRSSLQGTRPLRTPRAFLVGPHAHDSVSWFYCSQHGTDTSCMHHYSPWLSLDERQSIIRICFPDDETFVYHSRPCRSLRRSPSGATFGLAGAGAGGSAGTRSAADAAAAGSWPSPCLSADTAAAESAAGTAAGLPCAAAAATRCSSDMASLSENSCCAFRTKISTGSTSPSSASLPLSVSASSSSSSSSSWRISSQFRFASRGVYTRGNKHNTNHSAVWERAERKLDD